MADAEHEPVVGAWQGGLARATRAVLVHVRQFIFVDPRASDAEMILRTYRRQMQEDREATKRLLGALQTEAMMAQMNRDGKESVKESPAKELQSEAEQAQLPEPLVKPAHARGDAHWQPPETPLLQDAEPEQVAATDSEALPRRRRGWQRWRERDRQRQREGARQLERDQSVQKKAEHAKGDPTLEMPTVKVAGGKGVGATCPAGGGPPAGCGGSRFGQGAVAPPTKGLMGPQARGDDDDCSVNQQQQQQPPQQHQPQRPDSKLGPERRHRCRDRRWPPSSGSDDDGDCDQGGTSSDSGQQSAPATEESEADSLQDRNKLLDRMMEAYNRDHGECLSDPGPPAAAPDTGESENGSLPGDDKGHTTPGQPAGTLAWADEPVNPSSGPDDDGDSDQEHKPPRCPAGHELQLWAAGVGDCDGCSKRVQTGELVMDCRRCNWYLCNACCSTSEAQERLKDQNKGVKASQGEPQKRKKQTTGPAAAAGRLAGHHDFNREISGRELKQSHPKGRGKGKSKGKTLRKQQTAGGPETPEEA